MLERLRITVLATLTAGGLCVSRVFASASCPPDVDGDRVVDFGDVAIALLDFGGCVGCASDLDGSGVVDFGDVALLLLQFGPCSSWYTVLEQNPDPVVVYEAGFRAAIIATELPWRVRDNATGIEMVLIPPGSYQRGCSPSQQTTCWSNEYLVHQVTLTQAFYLGRTEVTQSQWVSKMGSNPSYFQIATPEVPAISVPNRPVERVSWDDIQPFCNNNGLRLPTEAEWEYACRAGTSTAFHGWPANPTGTNDDAQRADIAWDYSNSSNQTRPVGGKAANGFGLYDMSGNVYEWVGDRWGFYSSGPQTDPTGPGSGSDRTVRGGRYSGGPETCRASSRDNRPPDRRNDGIGFRVARTP